jgi:processive rubber oxygenase RoxA-like protein
MSGRFRLWSIVAALALAPAAWIASGQSEDDERNLLAPFSNPTGLARTFSTAGRIDTDNPFFQSLGTNGRACVTCHQPATGWTVTPVEIRRRFERTGGLDPIFRANDGSNSPLADVSTVEARRSAYSMLLTKGLIRVGIGIPAGAEFTLESADDPYGFATAGELSLFRRPLPSTNLMFLSTVMFDGRETFPGLSIPSDLMHQANSATVGHAQAAAPLTQEQREQIVAFETTLYTAQVYDAVAGDLTAIGARGGPKALSRLAFYIGINDPFGLNPGGIPFTPVVFTDFDAWTNLADGGDDGRNAARAAIARGQHLFDSKPIAIEGVRGLNDVLSAKTIHGTCGTCHDTPNVGNHSVAAPLDIGLTDAKLRTSDTPLYKLKRNGTGDVVWTTDPGRALVTGRWQDIGKFKGPILRGLAARAPYFHNGSAATLTDVVHFYNTRFKIGFTDAEIADLVAFLRAQ